MNYTQNHDPNYYEKHQGSWQRGIDQETDCQSQQIQRKCKGRN